MEEKKLRPFNLEKAKQGAQVVTRDGRNVRIICWDKLDDDDTYPIVALVKDKDGTEEEIETYTLDGACMVEQEYSLDLFMTPTILERWVNVYKDKDGHHHYTFYNSEQNALGFKSDDEYVATTKISWEE